MDPITIAVIGGAALLLAAAGSKKEGAPSKPAWPIINKYAQRVPDRTYRGGNAFGASRPYSENYNCYRTHGGIDLAGDEGDVLVAMENGTIAATQGWDGPRSKALLLQTDRGPVLLYGAIAPNSWKEFKLEVGSKVKKGQPIARLGVYPQGSTMLHFEKYEKGVKTNAVWCEDRPKPAKMIDPTDYLKSASNYYDKKVS
jgi:murein DD-endopeptidase MepM/ murein hydrolase activator NlpD